jgi:hypothetical protein
VRATISASSWGDVAMAAGRLALAPLQTTRARRVNLVALDMRGEISGQRSRPQTNVGPSGALTAVAQAFSTKFTRHLD